MKKIFALLLALVMVFSLAACGGGNDNPVAGGDTNSTNNATGTTDAPTDGTQGTPDITTPPATNPPATNPPATTPSATIPPATTPLATEPGHTHSYSTTANAPTCTEIGYNIYTCSCGHSYTEAFAEALGHKTKETPYQNGFVKPTCCSEGRSGAKEYCYVCNTIIKEGDVLPKNPYNHVGTKYTINKKEATWSQAGYTGDTCCDGCKNSILPENKGTDTTAHYDHSSAKKSYLSETDKIKYECCNGYIEYRDPDPISIQSIGVSRVLNLPGEGVKSVGFSITGGSLNYSVVKYDVISEYQYVPSKFGEVVQNSNFSNSYSIPLTEGSGYYIPDGTQIRIMITDSSGRSFDKIYTVRRHEWNNYEVIEA